MYTQFFEPYCSFAEDQRQRQQRQTCGQVEPEHLDVLPAVKVADQHQAQHHGHHADGVPLQLL